MGICLTVSGKRYGKKPGVCICKRNKYEVNEAKRAVKGNR